MIRLIAVEHEPARPEVLPALPVPATHHGCHEVVSALGNASNLLDVSGDARQRALLITQAIADECLRRGYRCELREDGRPSFQIAVGEDLFKFTLSEEFERREVVDGEQLAAAKYSWQRIPSSIRDVRSGRLLLRLGTGYGSVYWADRKRWTLEQKLPAMFKEVADRAASHSEVRVRKEAERAQRRQAWEEAVPQAKRAFVEQFNRNRLRDQAARFAEAGSIRDYCARLDSVAEQCADVDQADRIRQWANWARLQAARVDPTNHLDALTYVKPAEIRPTDFEKFMPKGMSAWAPPD